MQCNRVIDLKISDRVAPAISLEEVKTQLIITSSDFDDELEALIDPCTSVIENFTGVPLRGANISYVFDYYEEEELPFGIIDIITSVRVRTGTSSAGAAEFDVLTGDDYTTDGSEFFTFISSRTGRHYIDYIVQPVADTAQLKKAVLKQIAYEYEKRGDQSAEFVGQEIGVCKDARMLAMPYRRLNRL